MGLSACLEKEGFDKSTAETVVNAADGMSIEEAKDLLEGMLSAGHPQIAKYISQRQQPPAPSKPKVSSQVSQLGQKLPARITVTDGKPRKQALKHNNEASTEDKIDVFKELEAAIRQLSIDSESRVKCDCMGSKHGLLEMAPNCLNCGRIVCNKEGLGPCMFCKTPLLPTDRIKQIQDILNDQKDLVLGSLSKKALNQLGVDPSKVTKASGEKAEANLERLLNYQENDSQRTRIIDRVGEVDLPTPSSGKWMTPDEQAEHIRQQQRRLRQLEKQRKMKKDSSRKVISIDMKGKKTYQSVFKAEHIVVSDDDDEEEEEEVPKEDTTGSLEDAKPSSTTYYDPKQFIAPEIHSDVKETPTEINLPTTRIIRNEDETLLY